MNKLIALVVSTCLIAYPVSAQQATAVSGTSYTYQGNLLPLAVTSAVVSAAGGAASHSYVPSDTVTLTGGTVSTNAVITVTHTQLSSVNSVAAGGTGCTNGAGKTLTGTTGTGAKFQVSATASGNAIVSVESVSVAGDYTANPSSLTAEPVTGDSCTGTTLSINMGALTGVVTTQGVYTVVPANPVSQGASSGSGTGATWTLGFNVLGIIGPAWSVNLTSSNQTLSGTTLMHFNTSRYDTASICNTSSTFVCTPNVAGYYLVTCSGDIFPQTGPAVGGSLGQIEIDKNGSAVYGPVSQEAQVASLTNFDPIVQVSGIVQVNGSTDTLSCSAATGGSGTLTLLAGAAKTYMTGSFARP